MILLLLFIINDIVCTQHTTAGRAREGVCDDDPVNLGATASKTSGAQHWLWTGCESAHQQRQVCAAYQGPGSWGRTEVVSPSLAHYP